MLETSSVLEIPPVFLTCVWTSPRRHGYHLRIVEMTSFEIQRL
jgi:hypothetical protein